MFDYHNTNDRDLKIELAAPPRWEFSPGDTIIGHLVRKAPIVAPEATLRLTLSGRIKTTIAQNGRNSTQVCDNNKWTDEFDIFEPIQEIIFQGPLHLPENSDEPLSWPFSFEIPIQRAEPPKRPYISKHGFPPPVGLPGSFFSSGQSIGLSAEGSIRYTLDARIHYKRGVSHIIHRANCPIILRHLAGNFDPSQLRGLDTRISPDLKVQSQRLQPGMETSELSFKQKTLKLVGSSKVPEFHYNLIVSAPSVIQLDHPEPFPLILAIKSLREKTSPSIREVPQTVHIDSISATLLFETVILAPGHLGDSPRGDHQERSHDLGLGKVFQDLGTPLTICTEKGGGSIDVGNAIQLVLHSNGLSAGKRDLCSWIATTIYPDLDSCSIRHTHFLELKIRVSVAGESRAFKTRTPLKIIAAA